MIVRYLLLGLFVVCSADAGNSLSDLDRERHEEEIKKEEVEKVVARFREERIEYNKFRWNETVRAEQGWRQGQKRARKLFGVDETIARMKVEEEEEVARKKIGRKRY